MEIGQETAGNRLEQIWQRLLRSECLGSFYLIGLIKLKPTTLRKYKVDSIYFFGKLFPSHIFIPLLVNILWGLNSRRVL